MDWIQTVKSFAQSHWFLTTTIIVLMPVTGFMAAVASAVDYKYHPRFYNRVGRYKLVAIPLYLLFGWLCCIYFIGAAIISRLKRRRETDYEPTNSK